MEPAGAPQSGSGAQIDQSQMLLLRGWLCLSCLQNAALNRFLIFWTFFPTFLPWIYTHRASLWHTLQTKNIWFCHIRGSVCWEVSLGALVYPECSRAEWQTYTDDTTSYKVIGRAMTWSLQTGSRWTFSVYGEICLTGFLTKKKREGGYGETIACHVSGGSGHTEKTEQKWLQCVIHICISYTIFCCPNGSHPGPPLCPHFEVTPRGNFRPSWRLGQEMTSHAENEATPSDNDPLQLQVKGRRSHGGVWVQSRARVRVREMCARSGLWSAVGGEQFEWLMFSCERSCGMSGMCDCLCTCVLFCFSIKCVSVCVCVRARRSCRWRHMTWCELFWSPIYALLD